MVVVTCGPGIEPIDKVRRITNLSTGELGALLAEGLTAAGYRVVCLRGEAATWPRPRCWRVIDFVGGDDLAGRLAEFGAGGRPGVAAVFHAAALPDYRVHGVVDRAGRPVVADKLPGDCEELRVVLRRAPKVIDRLAEWFPAARLVGWKLELAGPKERALDRGRQLLARLARLDRLDRLARGRLAACVVNGAAVGAGVFCFLEPGRAPVEVVGKTALVSFLVGWLAAGSGPPPAAD